MNTLIPREKMSKKAKKELAKQKRIDWAGMCPITRVVRDKKKYNRAAEADRERKFKEE